MSKTTPLHLLKERIVLAYDVDAVCDLLDVDVELLLEAFEDRLIERREVFSDLELEDE